MSLTYTYVTQYGNRILSRGYDEKGIRFDTKEEFYPTLFTSSGKTNANTKWRDMHGNRVYEVKPGDIRECKEFIERYRDVDGFQVLGMTNWVTQYIGEKYPHEIRHDRRYTRIYYLDIETKVDNGFPDITTANEQISLITIFDTVAGEYRIYTFKKIELDKDIIQRYGIDTKDTPIIFRLFDDEYTMLKNFVIDWQTNCPDVITGWNSQKFDLPYIIRRINRVIGSSYADNLSPWKMVRERTIGSEDNAFTVYDIIGVSHLDLIDLMKKYTYVGRASWKLDNVAYDELGVKKLEYDGTFREHQANDWDHFAAYNLIDTFLVKRLDEKHNLIDLALTIAYDSKVNPEDVFSQIRSWDSLVYNELKKKGIVIPNNTSNHRDSFEGAYVKSPQVGKHQWVVSFDLQSLYPHLMMWANISPETKTPYKKDVDVEGLLTRKYNTDDLKEENLSMTANGVTFSKNVKGFLVEIVERIYEDRSRYKKQMLAFEQEYANTKKEHLLKEISRLNALQLARKIQINSVYGAMGSPYFRYYNRDVAEGITTSGQLAIRWVSNSLNQFLNKACKTKDIDYCIYNDTDSCYFTLEEIVRQNQQGKTTEQIVKFIDKFAAEVLQKVINRSYEDLADYMNAYQQKLIMKREVIADVGVFVAKKRYALSVHNSEGVQYKEPKLKVTGLELVRSSTPLDVRAVLSAGVKEVLHGTEESVQKFIADYRGAFSGKHINDISFPRGVNGLSRYAGSPIYTKGCPVHVRAALLYNHYLKKLKLDQKYELITEGSKIKFVYLRMPNPLKENVIGFIDKIPVEFGVDSFIDYDTMFEKSFVEAMKNILEPIGWAVENRPSLESLFE